MTFRDLIEFFLSVLDGIYTVISHLRIASSCASGMLNKKLGPRVSRLAAIT